MIVAACRWWAADGYVVNHDIVAGDIAHESAFWQSRIVRDKHNPSGLGAENDDATGSAYDKAVAFAGPWEGILATVAHMLTYAVGEGPWAGNDPRFAAVRTRGWLGAAPTLNGLSRRWAYPGESYGPAVAASATSLMEYAARQTGGIMGVSRATMERLLDERYPLRVRIAYVDTGNANIPNVPALPEGLRWLTGHETANEAVGANAEMHRRFVANGGGTEGVSFHWALDDHEVIGLVNPRMRAWQAGDGYNGIGNSSESTEVCVNIDGEWERTLENLARHWARRIVADENRSPERVAQHNKWSGKDCPRRLRANGGRDWKRVNERLVAILRDVGYYGEAGTVETDTVLVLPGQGTAAPEVYPEGVGLERGFKGTLLAMGAAKYPADPAMGVLTITGYVKEPEWLGEDGCVYQRCQRLTLQYNPAHGQPWDIVFMLPETELPWPAGKPRPEPESESEPEPEDAAQVEPEPLGY
jgi:hypothetical protein